MFIVPIEPMRPMEFSEPGKTLKPQVRQNAFQNVLDGAISALETTQRASQADAYRLAFGEVDNLAEVMINTMKAETMIQTTVQITSRMITAYKEIMNIQV